MVDHNRRGPFGKPAYGAHYAGVVIKEFLKSKTEMVEFGQETVESVQKIPSTLSGSLETTKKEFFNSENSQIVSELLRVINECTAVIKECISYYTMERHLSELREAGGPFGISEEEAHLISERWSGFISSCYRLLGEVGDIDNALGLPRPLLELAGISTQVAAFSSNNASHVKATTDGTEAPTPAKPRKPTLSRRLISCLSIKLFTND
ncbi:hypothetical protein AN958_04243 [Leucoagaricus sp. SymC.cos]|nr:hypothetical protein AN958_04243 [Leucoagaricus sp. SymC.cos]